MQIRMAIFWQNTSSCFQTGVLRVSASVRVKPRESACAVLDTHWLSPIVAPQAVSAETQPLRLTPDIPYPLTIPLTVPLTIPLTGTGLQLNAVPHSTHTALLPGKRSTATWRGSLAVDDQPEPLPGNAPARLPPQTSRLRVRRS